MSTTVQTRSFASGNTLRAGLYGAIFGFLLVIARGELMPYLGGIIGGLAAALIASQNEHPDTPAAGATQGGIAGVIAGVGVLLADIIRVAVINPQIGAAETNVAGALTNGFGGLVVAAALGALLGAVRALPSPRDNIGTLLIVAVLVIAYPYLDGLLGLRYMNEFIPILVFILMALGLNIVVGYAGMLDLGYAAFFAIGAYTTGMLASNHFGIQMNFWLAIWIAAAVAALFGILLGAPTLPLRGDYLAIVTLGFGEIVPIAIKNLDDVTLSIWGYNLIENVDVTGGTKGINPINRPVLPGIEFLPTNPAPWYFLILIIMVVSIFFIIRLRNSRLGRAWTAMREDELAAEAMGIDLVKTKLLAFAMGATFSGFAGAFYGSYISAIFPESFRYDVSVMLLAMVILGGLGNITGVILGGLLIQFADRIFLPEFSKTIQQLVQSSDFTVLKELNWQSDFRSMMFGLVLVIMMLVRPQGLVPNERRRREMNEKSDDAAVVAA